MRFPLLVLCEAGGVSTDQPIDRVVVVGGGIAGLAAAYYLVEAGHPDVLVLEAADRVGGKLRSAEVGGVVVDVGAESMLARRAEGTDLARAVGLSVVHPTQARPLLWTRGALRPLPPSVMGVPADLPALAASGVLSTEGLARVREDREQRLGDADLSVADLVGARLGREVVDRLVEPLLGGVYAGRAAALSARATVPGLVALAARGPLVAGAAALARASGPVFAGIEGGLARLAQALAASGRFQVRTGVTVRELHRTGAGFALVAGPVPRPERIPAAHVVVATPPAPAARLLAGVAPEAAAELAPVETASMAVVTLAYRAADVRGGVASDGSASGFLVPPVDGRTVKAATFSASKWAWVRAAGQVPGSSPDGVAVLRVSIGRHREEAVLQVPDDDLVAVARAEMAEATGLTAVPLDDHVQRWGGALPQYAVGHLGRVDRVRAAVERAGGAGVGRVAVCGAAYDGVGVPAVVASARRAAAGIGPRPGPGSPSAQ